MITGSVSLTLDKLLRLHRLQSVRDVVSLSPNLNCAFPPLHRDTSGPGLNQKWGIIISSQCISGCLSPWESASTARSALAAPHLWRPPTRKGPQRNGSGSPSQVGINFSAMGGLWWPNRRGFSTSPLSSFYWLVDFSSLLSEYSSPVSSTPDLCPLTLWIRGCISRAWLSQERKK